MNSFGSYPEIGETPIGKMNIRYNLDPDLVQASIEKAIDRLERLRTDGKVQTQAVLQKNPQARCPDPVAIDRNFDALVLRQRDYYSTVRVIELPKEGKRFVLAYGDQDDAAVSGGTGPFESFDVASKWFQDGGR